MFSKAIAKGSSYKKYDSCTTIRTNCLGPAVTGPGSVPNINGQTMVPFQTVFNLNTDTPAFIPYHCLNAAGSRDYNFTRHANMYTHYRIKCIRFEFVPTNAVTGNETSLPMAAVEPAAVTDLTANVLYNNAKVGSQVWMIKWPRKSTGTFQDLGYNLDTPVPVNQLITGDVAFADPSVIKIPVTEKLVLSWKPRILGYRTSTFRPLENVLGSAPQQTFYPVAKKFPWTQIIDNFEGTTILNQEQVGGVKETTAAVGFPGPYNTTGLRCPMTYPLIGCWDHARNQFMGAIDWAAVGRWTMHTVFEFKNKRAFNAGPITVFEETIPVNPTGFAVNPELNF